MAARQLCRPPAMMFYRWRFFRLSFFRRLISEVAWPIVTKLCQMFDGDPDFVVFCCTVVTLMGAVLHGNLCSCCP